MKQLLLILGLCLTLSGLSACALPVLSEETEPTEPAIARSVPTVATATAPTHPTFNLFTPLSSPTKPSATPTATATVTANPPTDTPLPTATMTASTIATSLPTVTQSLTPTPEETPRPTPWPTPDAPLTYEQRVWLFDELWSVVNERYIDANFYGVNWAAQYDYFRPRALNAYDDQAYYQELKEMVWTLKDEHSWFMDPHEAFEHFARTRNQLKYGGLGLYTMPTANSTLVLQVNQDSPAQRAGIQACDHILSLDGGFYNNDRGQIGSFSTLTIQRPNEGTFTLTLEREEITEILDVPGQVLPNRTSRIGYVRIDTLWVFDIPQRLRDRLTQLEADGPLDGLIIDLRPNLGGWRPVLQGILGTFVTGNLGEFSGRLKSDPLMVPRRATDPPPSHPDLPLAVLIGPRTESYAEVLAATLRAERAAIVIGQQTKGNVETIFPRRLPFGARVWIAEQGFRMNNGNTLEGIGVIPDIYDYTDWTSYPCASDPQIEMAAEALEGR